MWKKIIDNWRVYLVTLIKVVLVFLFVYGLIFICAICSA